jgi:cob(I)alamin adenosyltransferase
VKVYTRRGDGGETDLAGGARVSKDDPRVESYGAVDELNACIGLACLDCGEELRPLLQGVQRTLFEIGAVLATAPGSTAKALVAEGATTEDVRTLETAIDSHEAELTPLRAFVLPGGTRGAALFHLARTVCRRAERKCVSLERDEPVPGETLRYLNRLSDLLFVLARLENARAGVADREWTRRGG